MTLCASAVFNGGVPYSDKWPIFAGQGFNVGEAACEYQPRRPEESILYRVVAENIETFLARQKERGRIVPRFVERELRDFLDCGILARGFVRDPSAGCNTEDSGLSWPSHKSAAHRAG